jgi:hypothetical protein
MGRRPTRGVWGSGAPEAGAGRGGSRQHSGGRRRRTGGVAGGEGVDGSVDGGFQEAGGGGESRGAEDGGRRGRRRRRRRTRRRRWRRIEDEKVAKCWRGRVAAFIYRHTFTPGSCNKPCQKGGLLSRLVIPLGTKG